MAFIFAGIVLFLGLAFALLEMFAAGMSDNGYAGDGGAGATALGTVIIAALIAATHWLPHIGW